jgi:hypothetical protein
MAGRLAKVCLEIKNARHPTLRVIPTCRIKIWRVEEKAIRLHAAIPTFQQSKAAGESYSRQQGE